MLDTSKKNTIHLTAFIIFVVLSIEIMVIIFYFSAQNGLNSSNTSTSFSKEILKIFSPILPEFVINFIKTYIRKIAHFVSYFSLGITLALSTKEWLILKRPARKCCFTYYIISFSIALIYAISDEIHQYFIPGRSGKFADIVLDSSGSALGIVIIWVLMYLGNCRYKKSSKL